MTTIVYRDGILAADSLVTGSGCLRVDRADKLAVVETDSGERWAIGFAGNAGWIPRLKAWAVHSLPIHVTGGIYDFFNMPDPDDPYALLAVQMDPRPGAAEQQQRHVLVSFGRCGWVSITIDYAAIGNGEAYARGALEFGASAVEAVTVAARLDLHSGGPVTWIDVRSGQQGVGLANAPCYAHRP